MARTRAPETQTLAYLRLHYFLLHHTGCDWRCDCLVAGKAQLATDTGAMITSNYLHMERKKNGAGNLGIMMTALKCCNLSLG